MLCHTMQCKTIQKNTTQWGARRHNTIKTIPRDVVQYIKTLRDHAIGYNTVWYNILQYISITPSTTIRYNTTRKSKTQYNTL